MDPVINISKVVHHNETEVDAFDFLSMQRLLAVR